MTISVHGAAKATTERRRQAGGFMVNSSRRRWGTRKGSGRMRREIVAIGKGRDRHIKHNVRAQTWQAWGQHMWGTTRCMRMTTTTGHDTRDRDDRRELTGSAWALHGRGCEGAPRTSWLALSTSPSPCAPARYPSPACAGAQASASDCVAPPGCFAAAWLRLHRARGTEGPPRVARPPRRTLPTVHACEQTQPGPLSATSRKASRTYAAGWERRAVRGTRG